MADSTQTASWGWLAGPYWVQSRGPLASLVFVAPLLILYEVGVPLLGIPRNGADAALQWTLETLGLGQHFVPASLLICILLGWHYLSRQPWQLSGGTISAMAVESLLLGVGLKVVSLIQDAFIPLGLGANLKASIGFLGAGIYEELVFRLILLSLLIWAFGYAKLSRRWSLVAAVALSSLLFAAAHHIGPHGEALLCSRFAFRTLAGVFFAVVFLYRGFGIAAGSPAVYAILACLWG